MYIQYMLFGNIDCGYSLEPPRRGGSNVYPQSYVLSKNIQFELIKLCTVHVIWKRLGVWLLEHLIE